MFRVSRPVGTLPAALAKLFFVLCASFAVFGSAIGGKFETWGGDAGVGVFPSHGARMSVVIDTAVVVLTFGVLCFGLAVLSRFIKSVDKQNPSSCLVVRDRLKAHESLVVETVGSVVDRLSVAPVSNPDVVSGDGRSYGHR